MMERNNDKKELGRRDFFRSLGRSGLFAMIMGGSAYLLTRKTNNNSDCNFDFVCGNCGKKSHCSLPEASNFRMNNRKINTDEKR